LVITRLRAFAISLGALITVGATAGPLGAQSTTSLLPDAALLPRGEIRLRVLSGFTRYDELLDGSDTLASPRNLAADMQRPMLGTAEIPLLIPAQSAIQTLLGEPDFQISAGQMVATANSRVVTAPLVLEYGLTRRLSIGVVVPFVETRTTLYQQLNPRPDAANVGPNPALTNTALLASNAALVASLRSAAAALQQRLTACQSSPGDPGCAALLAQQSTASSLIAATSPFASALASLYGTDPDNPGQPFVPVGTDQAGIDAQIANYRTAYAQLLGSDMITGGVAGAGGPAARAQLQALMLALRRDTLQTTNRTSIGDVSVGASYQLANTFDDSVSSGLRYRIAVNGTFRFGTGEPADRNRAFDIGTGYGQPGVQGSAAADVQFRRFMATALGSYTVQLGSIGVGAIPNPDNNFFPLTVAIPGTYSAGDALTLSLIPRYRLSGFLSLDGYYDLLRTGADRYTGSTSAAAASAPATTAQQLGVGFTYSTLVGPDRAPGRLPVEISFSHLETLSGSGGPVPKTFRDQVEMRVYYRP